MNECEVQMKRRRFSQVIIAAFISVVVYGPVFASQASAYNNYVALGDSVASGAGLGADLDANCDRSSAAYPTLLARSLGTTVTNLACSGAKVDEGIYGNQSKPTGNVPAQLPVAFANGKPDLISITIGANDVRWSSFLRDCYVFECGSSLDKARAVMYRADLRLELSIAMQQIQQLSNGKPPLVLVNGYYNPISSADCDATAQITNAEASWLTAQKSYLNDSLRAVVGVYSFARYVPVNFGSHKLCSAETWVQEPNDAAPLHPNAIGQQALAKANLKALKR